jgi:hypothetical protein
MDIIQAELKNLIKNNLGLEILTDTGWSTFAGVVEKGVATTLLLQLERVSVVLTPDHRLFSITGEEIIAKSLRPGMALSTKTGAQRVVSIKTHKHLPVYDIMNVEKNNRFYANDILSHNCEFVSVDETLISPLTLAGLVSQEPIERLGQIRWFKKPKKGSVYVVSLDPSIGTGGDPAAIQIIEANTTEQVGEWKHNKTTIPEQVKLLAQIMEHIAETTNEPKNIYYSIENNTVGEAALVALANYGESNIPGTFVSEPGKKRKGFNTTNKTKLAACSKFKTLVESGKFKIHSRSLISELKSFIASGPSYAAKIGDTDDLVMAALLAVRIIQQLGEYHVDLENQISDYEELIMPLPFYAVFG